MSSYAEITHDYVLQTQNSLFLEVLVSMGSNLSL